MDVVSIGETMVLFSPNENGQLRYVQNFSTRIAGAETNTLIGLAKLGYKTGWISKIGKDEFGKRIRNSVRGEGVDVSFLTEDENAPTSLFIKEQTTAAHDIIGLEGLSVSTMLRNPHLAKAISEVS